MTEAINDNKLTGDKKCLPKKLGTPLQKHPERSHVSNGDL